MPASIAPGPRPATRVVQVDSGMGRTVGTGGEAQAILNTVLGRQFAGETITLDGVQHLGDYAFYRATGLQSVNIPLIETIGDSAFYGCEALTSVTIGPNITSIGGSAFSGCYQLDELTMVAVTPPALGNNAFDPTITIKVPSESLHAYLEAPGWDAYSVWPDVPPE